MKVNEQATSKENTVGHDTSYTYRMVSRVFRIPFEGRSPEKGILNMSDTFLYVFYIMAANQLLYCEFKIILIWLLMRSCMFM